MKKREPDKNAKEDGESDLSLVTVSAEVITEIWQEGKGDELLVSPES
ncbi:MAG: hypothetical protein WC827_01615 [Candidatus Paceibacterota bacterium]|jgi:hypothetical protein